MTQIETLFIAKGYYVLLHICIWRLAIETLFIENGQYSRPLLHKCIIQYTDRNVCTHSQMGLWARCGKECIFCVPQQSLQLLGTRTDVKRHNDPSSVLLPPLLVRHISPSISLSCFLLPSFPFCLLSFSHLLSSILLSVPPTFHPWLVIPPFTFCLSVAQHSMSWLSLNIDRKVNDNTAQVVHTAEL